MKRIFIFAIISILAVGSVFAEQQTLIDFTLLAKDGAEDGNEQVGLEGHQVPVPVNQATLVDYSKKADSSYTPDQRAIMKTSLALENWEVVLASSSQTPGNMYNSTAKEAVSRHYFGEETKVLGIRIHFPVEPFNSWAIIKPPFEIPQFEVKEDSEPDETTGEPAYQFGPGTGVVRNVGILKSIQVQAYGLRYPHALYVILIDDAGKSTKYYVGDLNFEGWGKLIWNNPAYVKEVRNRALRLYPLYPAYEPLVKFGGFQINRLASAPGGDFITYFKDVQIIFDQAVLKTDQGEDILNERVWNITTDRENAREKNQQKNLGKLQVERYMERVRQSGVDEVFNADQSATGGEQTE